MKKKSKIDVLKDIESIQKRPSWIIGKTDDPTQLVHEVLDNSIDEIIHDYGDEIQIFISDTDEIWVSDNGRGIEISEIEFDGKTYDSVVLICTKLFSGSKFKMEEDYKHSIGQHGVGLTAVNALSEFLNIYIRDRTDKKKIHSYEFVKSVFKKKEILVDNEFDGYNTIIHFKPSPQFFDTIKINNSIFERRLKLLKAKYPEKRLFFNSEEIKKITMEDFIREELNLPSKLSFFKYSASIPRNQSIEIWINYVSDDNKIVAGDVNLKSCEGKHLEYLQNEIKSCFYERYKDLRIENQNDLLLGLRLYASVEFPEPEFDSQTKTRMESRKVKPLIEKLRPEIEKFIEIPEVYKKLKANIEKKYSKKTIKGRKISFSNKLRDCTKIPGETLYLLEGDSADGSLKIIKDNETEASLPLRGKVLNVEKLNSIDAILKNEEVKNIIEAIGEINNRRYRQIKILCDADYDGMHIIVLLLLILHKFARDMIDSGNVKIILPPLYGASKGKEYVPIYNESEISHYRNLGYEITRFKGLGEMDPDHLEKTIRGGYEYVVKSPTSKQIKELTTIILNPKKKQEYLNNSNITSFWEFLKEIIENKKEEKDGETAVYEKEDRNRRGTTKSRDSRRRTRRI